MEKGCTFACIRDCHWDDDDDDDDEDNNREIGA